ncbi:WRKY DNA-binding transcription factor 70-like [Bidens hawaiensis]|uniref:WRKY DNA-binding transcription factor 70-like n=1 Tax=Bidens hawaiensis TaxID=980011 RepID=UPI004049852F
MEYTSWRESFPSNRIKAIQELIQGQALIDCIQEIRGQPENNESSLKSVDTTLVQIIKMFDKTRSILNSTLPNFNVIPQNRTYDHISSPNNLDDIKSEDSMESVVIPVKTKRGCYKRRKSSSVFTNVTSTLIDDGHAWRKYGEKVIHDSKYKRQYYRCTHKFDQRCQATKHVQKIDDEPPMYRTTYYQHHTCKNLQTTHQIILDSPNSRDNSVLFNFETNTIIKRNQVGPFSSLTKHNPKEGIPCLSTQHNNVSSSDYNTTKDPITRSSQISLKPNSAVSSGLDHENKVCSGVFSSACSTHPYEICNMLGSNDFGEILSELCNITG